MMIDGGSASTTLSYLFNYAVEASGPNSYAMINLIPDFGAAGFEAACYEGLGACTNGTSGTNSTAINFTFTQQRDGSFLSQEFGFRFQMSATAIGVGSTAHAYLDPLVSIDTNSDPAFSNASFLFSPSSAVPEPASWLTAIIGFGLVGGTARRRRAFATA